MTQTKEITRKDGRANNAMRFVQLEPNFAPHAAGSVLMCVGNTRVICAASLEKRVPGWMVREGKDKTHGWVSAEYSLLPYSTLTRKPRDISKGRLDGRTVEIQRLIGRALRAVMDLSKIPGHSLAIDCDVLQADGGTRTAAITGAYVAAQLAVRSGAFDESPFTDSVAAVSAGMVDGTPLLDLCYEEDYAADVDANIVMTGSGRIVEVQSAGEEATFTREELDAVMNLAEAGIAELTQAQKALIALTATATQA